MRVILFVPRLVLAVACVGIILTAAPLLMLLDAVDPLDGEDETAP